MDMIERIIRDVEQYKEIRVMERMFKIQYIVCWSLAAIALVVLIISFLS